MNWKKPTLIALWSLVALVWLAVLGVYFSAPSKTVWIVTVTGAAVMTEIAVWSTATILGLTVIESRKQIWAKISAPLRKQGF